MINSEFPLGHIADTVLPPDMSWRAACQLGKYVAKYMDATPMSEGEDAHYFHLNDVDEALCGVSEQPDLTGEVVITMGKIEGTWRLGDVTPATALDELRTMPTGKGSVAGFRVMHAKTAQTLLQLALPLSRATSRYLQQAHAETYSSRHHLLGIMPRYNARDVAFEPRRVQAAAFLTRKIVEEQVAPSYFLMTPEEKEAFLDKYFEWQDVPITGGGGKTVRMHMFKPLPKKAAPEPVPSLQQAPGVRVVDAPPTEVIHLPEGDVTE